MDEIWVPTADELQLRLQSLYTFIDTYRHVCDAHSVDYYIKNHWDSYFPDHWKVELETVQSEDVFVNPQTCDTAPAKGSLLEFLHEAKRLRLPLVTGCHDDHRPSRFASFGMTAKKSHEVEKFSSFVSQFILRRGLKQVVDVGSGKGYLSEYLALSYGVTVVGFDSQSGNTQGAVKRNKKVHKEWRNVTRATTSDDKLVRDKEAKVDYCTRDITFKEDDLNLSNLFSADVDHPPTCSTIHTVQHPQPSEDDIDSTECVGGVSEHSINPTNSHMTNFKETEDYSKNTNLFLEHTASFIDTSKKKSHGSFYPVTMEITHSDYNHPLLEAEKSSLYSFKAKDPFCIVGLHSCGDLTSTALRMFVSVPNATAVCVVGCCYHHITERGISAGFPLSDHLRSSGAHLGRTSRMLACQTLARFAETTSKMALMRIHWRAMLQVLLSRKFPELFSKKCDMDLMVGRLKRAPKEFKEYCFIALERLGLDKFKVNAADVENVEHEFQSKLSQLQCFIRVRAVLASCIESFIILDRLLYVHEQKCTQQAGLVQLFDPAVSPRCYAIAALK